MALNQVIKLPSEQGSFDRTGNKNNVDFVLPGGVNYDLSKSYVAISIDTSLDVANITDEIAKGYLHMGTKIDGTGADSTDARFVPTMATLVRNAYMSSQKSGKITDIRRVDKYAFTKAYYKLSREDMANDLGAMCGLIDNAFVASGSDNEYSAIGVNSSKLRTHDIRINLKDIMPFCRINNYDASKYGDTRIHLEINFDSLELTQSLYQVGRVPKTSGGVGVGGIANTGNRTDLNGTNEYDVMGDMLIAADITSRKSFKTKGKFGNQADIPFFIGMQVGLVTAAGAKQAVVTPVATGTGVPLVNNNVFTIEELKYNDNDDTVEIILSNEILQNNTVLLPGDTITNIHLEYLNYNVKTIDIKNVELVTQIVNESAPKSGIVYETILSEEDNYPQSSNLNRVYEIPPMCKNFYIMFFESGSHIASRENGSNDLEYRFAIDNIEQSTRPIRIMSPRHKDLVQKVFLNNGEVLQNMNERYFKVGGNVSGLQQGIDHNYFIGQPVPFLQRSQKLQIELTRPAGTNLNGRHIIFYDVVKQLN